MTENLIDAIRAAVAEGAPAEVRVAGANACRILLTELDPQPVPPSAPPPPPPQPNLPIGAIVAAIRGMPAEQLADLLIARLRTLVPADAAATSSPARPFNIEYVKVPKP